MNHHNELQIGDTDVTVELVEWQPDICGVMSNRLRTKTIILANIRSIWGQTLRMQPKVYCCFLYAYSGCQLKVVVVKEEAENGGGGEAAEVGRAAGGGRRSSSRRRSWRRRKKKMQKTPNVDFLCIYIYSVWMSHYVWMKLLAVTINM